MICAKSEVLPVVPSSSYQLVAGLHVRVGSEVVKLSAECVTDVGVYLDVHMDMATETSRTSRT